MSYLTPKLLHLKWIETWDGIMPKTMLSDDANLMMMFQADK